VIPAGMIGKRITFGKKKEGNIPNNNTKNLK
jgi:hypothetical protein